MEFEDKNNYIFGRIILNTRYIEIYERYESEDPDNIYNITTSLLHSEISKHLTWQEQELPMDDRLKILVDKRPEDKDLHILVSIYVYCRRTQESL